VSPQNSTKDRPETFAIASWDKEKNKRRRYHTVNLKTKRAPEGGMTKRGWGELFVVTWGYDRLTEKQQEKRDRLIGWAKNPKGGGTATGRS